LNGASCFAVISFKLPSGYAGESDSGLGVKPILGVMRGVGGLVGGFGVRLILGVIKDISIGDIGFDCWLKLVSPDWFKLQILDNGVVEFSLGYAFIIELLTELFLEPFIMLTWSALALVDEEVSVILLKNMS
jgi:hypothetical protein